MKPVDDKGVELDAIFTIEPTDEGVLLFLESRGGAAGGPHPPRNADYIPGFEILLRRLGAAGAVLTDIEVYSSVTRPWSIEERRLSVDGYSLPLDLNTIGDTRDLRIKIGRASTALGRAPGRSGGNPTKRLRLTLVWPGIERKSAGEIEDDLAGITRANIAVAGSDLRYAPLGGYLRASALDRIRLRLSEIERILGSVLPRDAWTPQFWSNASGYHQPRRRQWLDAGFHASFERRTETVVFQRQNTAEKEQPTDDPSELRVRVERAKARRRRDRNRAEPPLGSEHAARTTASTTRYVRDPEVVAWVLLGAQGACEVCGELAPFVGKDGEPFLEVHHVRPLGEGGPDQVDNAVAACPNCHRRLHYGADRDLVRSTLIEKIDRLEDYAERV